ncbi:MAG: YraN family protein [Bryobacteraceae bacterium]|jgi:putative endonuclease
MMGLLYRAAAVLRRRAIRDDHGRVGEDLAHRYLRRRGCAIVARNYQPPAGGGELDLVAWQGATLVFVEVKTRTVTDFGTPDRAVDREKRVRVERAARDYARRAGADWEKTRFDIVSVVLEKRPRIEWIQDAWRGPAIRP